MAIEGLGTGIESEMMVCIATKSAPWGGAILLTGVVAHAKVTDFLPLSTGANPGAYMPYNSHQAAPSDHKSLACDPEGLHDRNYRSMTASPHIADSDGVSNK